MQLQRAVLLASVIILGLGFAVKLNDSIVNTVSLPQELPQPSFEIRKRRGFVWLAGHTASTAHENNLRTVAARLFPDHTIETQFQPLGIVPTYWQDLTTQSMYALQATDSGIAVLAKNAVNIRAIVVDEPVWQNRLTAMRAVLPQSVQLQDDTILVAHSDAERLCARAVDGFKHDPIHFEESTAVMRRSAYPVLQRIAALGRACKTLPIRITGHTDASGSESANRALSGQRAAAVATLLESLGIAAERMTATGAGSSDPVATNTTRYGRSLNRRIEIRFSARVPS